MTEQSFAKAKLIELDEKLTDAKPGGKTVIVQFNPDSLKVTYSNEIKKPEAGDQASGTAGIQIIGKGTTKLALTLWFDVTATSDAPTDDVRRKTNDVTYFMRAQESTQHKGKMVPPAVRFIWGSFQFDGMVEALEETIEFFSPEGIPLRASMSLTLSQQDILVSKLGDEKAGKRPGQRPYATAKDGDSVQDMAGAAGKGGDWQGIASANGIEDPLRLSPGAMLDLNAGAGFSAGAGISGGIGISGGFDASASLGGGASIGGSASASLGASVQGGVQTPPLPRFGLN